MSQPPAKRVQTELFGTKAGAQLRPIKLYKTVNNAPQDMEVTCPRAPSRGTTSPSASSPASSRASSARPRCVTGGSQEMMEALLKSAETGREVRLDS